MCDEHERVFLAGRNPHLQAVEVVVVVEMNTGGGGGGGVLTLVGRWSLHAYM